VKGLYKIDPADLSSAAPGKVSELVLDFAAPLLRLGPNGLPDIDALRSVLQLAEICWNLPVYERTDKAKHAEFKRGFDSVLQSVPAPIANLLRQLLHERTTRFGAIPFLVTVRVEGQSLDRANVIAEARVSGMRCKP
jgi:hypothetical protein